MVEGARLESEYGPKAHRGFESLPLRQPPRAPLCVLHCLAERQLDKLGRMDQLDGYGDGHPAVWHVLATHCRRHAALDGESLACLGTHQSARLPQLGKEA